MEVWRINLKVHNGIVMLMIFLIFGLKNQIILQRRGVQTYNNAYGEFKLSRIVYTMN